MKRKQLTFFVSAIASISIISACSFSPENKMTERIPEDSVAPTKNQKETKKEDIPDSTASDKTTINKLEHVPYDQSIGKVNTYNLSSFFKDRVVTIAPEFIHKNHIFYYDNREGHKNLIYRYDMNKKQNISIYSTSKKFGMMTGTNSALFWLELDKPTKVGIKWAVMKMDVETKQVKKLDSGESRFQTMPPYIEVANGKATWITHDATETETISYLKTFSLLKNKTSTLQTFKLKEGEQREGIFPFDYRESDAGLIIHKSTFNKGNKNPTLETKDGTYKQAMNGLIDFDRGVNYVALGQEGKALFQNIHNPKNNLEFLTSDPRLTADAFNFISPNRVVFREGMNQLFYADLKKKTVSPLTSYDETTTKPKLVDNRLIYAVSGLHNIKFKVLTLKK
ncbi:hypothetical protein AS033_15840 [Exiguobacterium indicum]|uniref:Lipoprotein n=1 Tax=Exiguobacterium indicum TaxID=296995 RepID=A0A0V8GBW9_9BACL|nr:hypothetical protein [Exiguobacterium enclense]KSU47723.1 hypothetical protein AS033_15840 [Exiguobacterium enclense]SDD46628.1 hypothetical protein SAMN05216342_3228 [Exiguobacterium enclense]